MPRCGQNVERFAHGRIAAAEGDDAERAPSRFSMIGARHELGRGLVLPQQAVHHFLILVRHFGVAAELVVAGAAREECALRMHAGQRARRDVVLVLAAYSGGTSRIFSSSFRVQHAAAIGPVGVVPGEARHHPVVHADVEIGQHEDRRLEALRQIERL